MGPQAHGHCHDEYEPRERTRLSSCTFIPGEQDEMGDGPSRGRRGRLRFLSSFYLELNHRDWQHAWEHAVDILYHVHLHYEMGK